MGPSSEKAWLLYHSRRFRLAQEEAERALVSEPHSASLHSLIALCHVGQSRFAAAREAAERAIQLGPSLALAHYVLAWTLYRDEKFDCRRDTLSGIAPAEVRKRRLLLAEGEMREAVRLAPQNASYLGILAFIRNDLGDPETALEVARQGLAANPRDPNCLRVQAIALRSQPDAQTASAASAAVIRAEPEASAAHLIHGRTLMASGEFDKAYEHLLEALRLDPTSEITRRVLLDAVRSRHPLYRALWRLGFFADHLGSRRLQRARQGRALLLVLVLFVFPVYVFVSTFGTKLARTTRGALTLAAALPAVLILFVPPGLTLWAARHPDGAKLVSPTEKRAARIAIGTVICTYLVVAVFALIPLDAHLNFVTAAIVIAFAIQAGLRSQLK